MIDSHCHLDFPEILPILPEVLTQAKQAGINHFVVPAVGQKNWRMLKNLAAEHSEIYVAYGIHPWFLQQVTPDDLSALAAWVFANKCLAIGECGLDFYHGRTDITWQTKVFSFQLDLAKQQQLPVIIHSRKAVAEVLQLCKKYRINQGVLHGFAGSIEQAQQAIKQGFYLGVGGVICNEQSSKIRKMVAQLPLTNILLETDAPDQGLTKNAHGTPADIVPIAHALAVLHGVSFEAVMVQCAANANDCFGVDFIG